MKNTGEETLVTNDIYNAILSNPDEENRGNRRNSFFYESIVAKEAIKPGESWEGQYRFIYNFNLSATEITWHLSAEEVSN